MVELGNEGVGKGRFGKGGVVKNVHGQWLYSVKNVQGYIVWPSKCATICADTLSSYSIRNAFKLYLNDIGMLKEMAAVTNESLVLDRDFAFKGRFVENYVLQQLAHRCEGSVHYWAERAEREIDFVLQQGGEAIPVEVKAGGDRKCASFKSFVNANSPKYAIRFSERNLKQDGKFVNIPLYLAERYQFCL